MTDLQKFLTKLAMNNISPVVAKDNEYYYVSYREIKLSFTLNGKLAVSSYIY